jgi:hypothetical protein
MDGSEERRVAVRVDASVLDRGVRCRVLPGQEARLVNLSSYGLLVDTPRPLAPGREVCLQVAEPLAACRTVQGRVIRCAIVALGAQGDPVFRSGIALPESHGLLRKMPAYERQQQRRE